MRASIRPGAIQHALLWRAAFGFPAQILSRDRTLNLTAGFGFFALLRVAIRDEFAAPPEVVVVFDGQNGSAARKQVYDGYKANRRQDSSALAPILALPDVKRGLDQVGICWVEVDDAEADDVIATLTARCRDREVRIMSGDRDFYQLVNNRVRVLNTAMHPGTRHIGPDEIQQRHQVAPAQWACYRALTGDIADNIPGVKGVGATTAARLLAGGLTLDDLPTSGRLTGAKGRAITDTWDSVLVWRDMIRLRTDVPVPFTPTGQPSPQLPRPADVVELLNLW